VSVSAVIPNTEVILRLSERDRPETDLEWSTFLRSLNGIFALAIWDGGAGTVRVARHHTVEEHPPVDLVRPKVPQKVPVPPDDPERTHTG